LGLKLYPHFFRIIVADKKTRKHFIEKFQTIGYLRYIKESQHDSRFIIIGFLVCPLIVYRQLLSYFDRLVNKGIIEDYFLKQVRRFRISFSISKTNYKPISATYQQLWDNPNKHEFYVITALDETYDITKSSDPKKTAFDEDVLMFLSAIWSRNLGKAHYVGKPLDVLFELSERKGIDTSDLSAVLYYINQMDNRCRRLGLLDYYLYVRELIGFSNGLYYELSYDSNKSKIDKLLSQLEPFGERLFYYFRDRVVIIFPLVQVDSPFKSFFDQILREYNISFVCTSIRGNKQWKIPHYILYHELFDFKNKGWKDLKQF
jgi:hypothetical protein